MYLYTVSIGAFKNVFPVISFISQEANNDNWRSDLPVNQSSVANMCGTNASKMVK